MPKRKLVENLSSDAQLPISYNTWDDDYKFRNVPDMPIVYWPNGAPCIEVNMFLMNGVTSKSWSIKSGGGTARTYATNLSHIVRFCFDNSLHFSDLTDSYFELFVNRLQAEKHENGKPVRSNSTIVSIGRDTIKLLMYVGKTLRDRFLIGSKGCKLTVVERQYRVAGTTRKYYSHYALPSKDPYHRRLPIAHSDEKKLYKHVSQNSDKAIVARDTCLIKAFRATGGRRGEVANLRVTDVERALHSDDAFPLLNLVSLKQRNNDNSEITRKVPVPRATLKALWKYIKKYRARTLKKIKQNRGLSKSGFVDHDCVFISETTGQPLKKGTITTYFNRWAKEIGASGSVVAHAFRHTFITEKIEMLISLFELKDKDDLKAKFATEESFKLKLLEWTGHKSVKSLENYIHLAFEGISGVNATMDKALILDGIRATNDELEELKQRIINGEVNAAEAIDEIEHLLNDCSGILEQ